MIRFLFLGLVTIAANATETTPPSEPPPQALTECELKLTPLQQELAHLLTVKKKNMTALIGEPSMTGKFFAAVLAGSEEAKATPLFQFKDVYRENINTPENNAILTTSLLKLKGFNSLKEELLFADWLNKVRTSSGITLINVATLSIKQQKELVKIYDVLPAETSNHFLFYAVDTEEIIPALRERIGTAVLNINGEQPNTEKTKEKAQQVRQLAEDILKPQTSLWVRHISTKTRFDGSSLLVYTQTLLKTLTANEIDYFIMAGGVPNLDSLHFSEKFGAQGKINGNDEDDKPLSFSSWLAKLDGKIGNPIRLIIIPTPFLSRADKDAMEDWLEEMKTHKNASQFRIILHDFTPDSEVEIDIGLIK